MHGGSKIQIIMKCTLRSNFESLSGRCGNVLYKTFKKPDGSKETRAYFLPRKENGKYGYQRKSPVSKGEIAARAKFSLVTQRLQALSEESKLQFAKQWKKDKFMLNGKKYATLRGYIMARLYAQTEDFKGA